MHFQLRMTGHIDDAVGVVLRNDGQALTVSRLAQMEPAGFTQGQRTPLQTEGVSLAQDRHFLVLEQQGDIVIMIDCHIPQQLDGAAVHHLIDCLGDRTGHPHAIGCLIGGISLLCRKHRVTQNTNGGLCRLDV